MYDLVSTLTPLLFDKIFFNFAGNKDNHKSLHDFEFQPDSITDCGVSCSCVSEKSTYYLVNTL